MQFGVARTRTSNRRERLGRPFTRPFSLGTRVRRRSKDIRHIRRSSREVRHRGRILKRPIVPRPMWRGRRTLFSRTRTYRPRRIRTTRKDILKKVCRFGTQGPRRLDRLALPTERGRPIRHGGRRHIRRRICWIVILPTGWKRRNFGYDATLLLADDGAEVRATRARTTRRTKHASLLDFFLSRRACPARVRTAARPSRAPLTLGLLVALLLV